MTVQIARKHFTVTDYYRMVDVGILSLQDRVELIEGEVIEMCPIGSRHAGCVNRLNSLFNRLVGQEWIVAVQNPVYLNQHNELQPDISLLKYRDDFYASLHPRPDEVQIIVEVADTSVGFDQEVKLPVYAQAGIQEVWIVNLVEDKVEVYTQPVGEKYQLITKYGRDRTLKAESLHHLLIKVDEILG